MFFFLLRAQFPNVMFFKLVDTNSLTFCGLFEMAKRCFPMLGHGPLF